MMLFCTLGTRSNLAFKSEHQGSKLKISDPWVGPPYVLYIGLSKCIHKYTRLLTHFDALSQTSVS